MRVLIIFRNYDDRDYDKFILGPEGMGVSATALLADKIAAEAKAKNPEEWQWYDDIESALIDAGFTDVAWAHVDERD